jgi:predicted PurR-regulated permease PerM
VRVGVAGAGKSVRVQRACYNLPVTRLTPLLRLVLLGLLLFGLGWLLFRIRAALTPVFFAMLVSYVLDPLVDRMERAHVPRSLGIAILLFVAVLGLGSFVFFVLPTVVSDLIELLRTLAIGLVSFAATALPWLQKHGVPVPPSVASALEGISSNALGLVSEALAPMGDVVSAAVGGTVSLIGALSTIVMVPVFSFYFLHDFNHMIGLWRDLLPASVRADVVVTAKQVDRVLGDFVRGQLTVMAIMATLYAAGYSVVGVPLAVPIGLLAGFLTFIPYVGSATALVFGLLMELLHFHGIGSVVAVIAVYFVIQMLEGFVITPRVVGGRLGLSPVWVLFALMAFGQMFGFVGVMLALPASAVLKVFVNDGMARYRRSAFYLGTPTGHELDQKARSGRLRVRRLRRARLRAGQLA